MFEKNRLKGRNKSTLKLFPLNCSCLFDGMFQITGLAYCTQTPSHGIVPVRELGVGVGMGFLLKKYFGFNVTEKKYFGLG